MKYFITIVLTLLVSSILLFIFQNREVVNLYFLTYQTEVISGIVILVSVFLGVLFTLTAILPNLILKKYKIKDLSEEIERLKIKLKNETIQYESDGLGSEGMDYKEKKG